jgi:hypothetical protein
MLNQCTEITEVAKSLNLVCVNNSHLKVNCTPHNRKLYIGPQSMVLCKVTGSAMNLQITINTLQPDTHPTTTQLYMLHAPNSLSLATTGQDYITPNDAWARRRIPH